MAKFHNFQTNFSGGLLSEGMLGRVDLAQYENGCKQLENWWPKVTGGMRRRPGSVNLTNNFLNNTDDGRIESFIFNETQGYIIMFAAFEWRAFDLDGVRLDGGNTMFSADVVKDLSITQVADVMFIAHPSTIMKELRRTSATTFTYTDFVWEGTGPQNTWPKKMPFIKYADQFVAITPSGYQNNLIVTVTASQAGVFKNTLVNTTIRYRGKQMLVTSFIDDQHLLCQIKEELDQGTFIQIDNAENRPHDFIVGEIVVGRDSGVKGEVITTGNNQLQLAMIAGQFASNTTEEIEGLTSGNIAQITGNFPTNPQASNDWDEEAFSIDHGYPAVIEFHSQRLWLAGSSSLPAHIWGSRVAAFFNFDVGDGFPADSIQVSIVGKQINLVTDIVSGRHLQVFTDRAEFYAPQSDDKPLVPETFDLLPQTRYGSKRRIEPKVFDESTIFVQAQGSAVREMIWQDNARGYSADAISLIAEEHINDVKEVEVLYGGYDRPEQIVFFVNGDGTITWYHSARAEAIRTWGKWTTQGLWRSLCVIQDKLYALCYRDKDGEQQGFIERFELNSTLDNEVTEIFSGGQLVWQQIAEDTHPNRLLDCVIRADNSNAEPDHYLGSSVSDANGSIDLTTLIGITQSIDNLTVGLPFTQTLEIMPIEIKDQEGITGGKAKRIIYSEIYMASTLAIELNGHHIHTFQAENDLTIAPEPITGMRKFYLLGYQDRPTLTVTNSVPLACELLSIGAEVEY